MSRYSWFFLNGDRSDLFFFCNLQSLAVSGMGGIIEPWKGVTAARATASGAAANAQSSGTVLSGSVHLTAADRHPWLVLDHLSQFPSHEKDHARNSQKTSGYFSEFTMGKSSCLETINHRTKWGTASVAMLNYQRVSLALLSNVHSKPVVVRFVWVRSLRRQTVNGFDYGAIRRKPCLFLWKTTPQKRWSVVEFVPFRAPAWKDWSIGAWGYRGLHEIEILQPNHLEFLIRGIQK